jgi:hypothetical protein
MKDVMPILCLLFLWFFTARAQASASTLIELHNAESALLISVETGKVVSWSSPQTGNLLWLAEPDALQGASVDQLRGDRGGVSVYPAQEKLWHFIWGKEWSAEDYERLNWKLVEQQEDKAVLVCEQVPPLDIRLRRDIVMDGTGMGFSIIDSAERTATNPIPVMLWTVTQLPVPRGLWLESIPVLAGRRFTLLGNRRYFEASSVNELEDLVSIDISTALPGLKIGTFGEHLVAEYPRGLLLIRGAFSPNGAYPDAASLEAYVGEDFVEMETVSVAAHVQPGERLELTTRWCFLSGVRFDPTHNPFLRQE